MNKRNENKFMKSNIIEKYEHKVAVKQKLIFLALCSNKDENLILHKQKMTLEDFDRIMFLLNKLEFNEFSIELGWEYMPLLSNYDNLSNISIKLVTSWEKTFCENISLERVKKYLKYVFNV